MPTSKHLVLDNDVYEALLGRKEMTGEPIGRIGNSILRVHIAAALLEDLVGKKLVEAGRLSDAEYADVLHQASEELRRMFHPARVTVEVLKDGTMVAGSWRIQSLQRSEDGSFHLLECWARDALQRPMAQHVHDAHEFLVSMGGRCFVVMGGLPFTLTKGNMLQVPAGAAHSAVPLDAECHLLALTIPATAEYSPHLQVNSQAH